MKPFISQLKWLMAASCMLAVVSTCTVVASVHAAAESEIVEFEEIEVMATRRTVRRVDRRLQKVDDTKSFTQFNQSLPLTANAAERSERSQLNGVGAYLLT